MKKERSDNQSNTSGNSSSSERGISTEEEEFSDNEHVLLVTSVANLRRRESMNLQPLRTKSKDAPRITEKKKIEEDNQPLLGLKETREIIHNQMMKDERKIQNRNPKKQLISE